MRVLPTDDQPEPLVSKVILACKQMCARPDLITDIRDVSPDKRSGVSNFFEEKFFRYNNSSTWSVMRTKRGEMYRLYYYTQGLENTLNMADFEGRHSHEEFDAKMLKVEDRQVIEDLYFAIRARQSGIEETLEEILKGSPFKAPVVNTEISEVTSMVDSMLSD